MKGKKLESIVPHKLVVVKTTITPENFAKVAENNVITATNMP